MRGYSVGCSVCFCADDTVLIAFSLVFKATTGRFRFLSMLSRPFILLGRLSALSWEYHRIETVALDKGCLENICWPCMSLTLDKQNRPGLDQWSIPSTVCCSALTCQQTKSEKQPQSEALKLPSSQSFAIKDTGSYSSYSQQVIYRCLTLVAVTWS